MAFKVKSIEPSDDGQILLVTFTDSDGNQMKYCISPGSYTARDMRIYAARLIAQAEVVEIAIADLKKEFGL